MTLRQWLGLCIAILAGYSILGWPSLSAFLVLPLWVWLSFANTLPVAANQGITRAIKRIDPFVKNFWGGLTTLVLCLAATIVLSLEHSGTNFLHGQLIIVSLTLGIVVIGMWSFNLVSYKAGATIGLKNVVMYGTHLTTMMILGVVVFDEAMSLAKLVGMALYFVAFALMDRDTWQFCKMRIRRYLVAS